jgi:hypothetical protein
MMRKVPTTSDTAAKTSRKVVMKDRPFWISVAICSETLSPVTASKPAGNGSVTATKRRSLVSRNVSVTRTRSPAA